MSQAVLTSGVFSVGTKYRLSLWANLAPSSPAAGLRLSLALKEISDAEVRAHGRACRRRLPAVLAGLPFQTHALWLCVAGRLAASAACDAAQAEPKRRLGERWLARDCLRRSADEAPARERSSGTMTWGTRGSVADRGCLVAGVAVHVKLLDAGTVWLDDLALVTA